MTTAIFKLNDDAVSFNRRDECIRWPPKEAILGKRYVFKCRKRNSNITVSTCIAIHISTAKSPPPPQPPSPRKMYVCFILKIFSVVFNIVQPCHTAITNPCLKLISIFSKEGCCTSIQTCTRLSEHTVWLYQSSTHWVVLEKAEEVTTEATSD